MPHLAAAYLAVQDARQSARASLMAGGAELLRKQRGSMGLTCVFFCFLSRACACHLPRCRHLTLYLSGPFGTMHTHGPIADLCSCFQSVAYSGSSVWRFVCFHCALLNYTIRSMTIGGVKPFVKESDQAWHAGPI
ncbi:unnamed protein product [Scytosiphon promiscuus]